MANVPKGGTVIRMRGETVQVLSADTDQRGHMSPHLLAAILYVLGGGIAMGIAGAILAESNPNLFSDF